MCGKFFVGVWECFTTHAMVCLRSAMVGSVAMDGFAMALSTAAWSSVENVEALHSWVILGGFVTGHPRWSARALMTLKVCLLWISNLRSWGSIMDAMRVSLF